MSQMDDGKVQDIANQALNNQLPEKSNTGINSDVEYPFDDSSYFDDNLSFGTMDVAVVGNDTVSGFSVADDISELPEVIEEISRVRAYLEKEGYEEVSYHGLVDDERILELKEIGEELAPIFSQSRIEDKLDGSESLSHFYESGLLGELHTIARRGYETGQEVVARNDYEMLEDFGLVEERNGLYFPTETLDVLLASREDILHLTPRASSVYHPEELGYE